MSFSSEAKEEMARIRVERPCCLLAELSGLSRGGFLEIHGSARGALPVPGPKLYLAIEVELSSVARRIINLAKHILGVHPVVHGVKRPRFGRAICFLVKIPVDREILLKLGITSADGSLQWKLSKGVLPHGCCPRAYLRGLFLGSGSISHPSKGHHLEIVVRNEDMADQAGQLLFDAGISVRLGARKDQVLLYLKEADHIADFLNLVGAHRALMAYENTRAMKEVKERVNRLVNAETANLAKSVEAAVNQIEDIKLIEARVGLSKLPAPLAEIAQLRLNQPEASLTELGEQCDPPVGKSGVNHRLRRLANLARKIKGNCYSGSE